MDGNHVLEIILPRATKRKMMEGFHVFYVFMMKMYHVSVRLSTPCV